MGVVELNIRIRDFEKPWLFHVLADLEYPCILGIDFIGGSKIILDFDRKSLAIPDSQINKVVKKINQGLRMFYIKRLTREIIHQLFLVRTDMIGLNKRFLIITLTKMLKEGTIIPIRSSYASPVELCRKNNELPPDNPEAYRFAVDYRKLNAITKYPRYPLPLIDDLIMNIPHTGIMSALDLRSGYFQMAVNPSDIVKTAFVTKNGTYAFRRMPFRLSGAAPNFQKAIDIILKPVIGKFVNVYQVRIYRHRKCDETDIGTGSSDNGSWRDESSGFDRTNHRDQMTREMVKKKGQKTNHSLTKFRKKSRREETVTPTTSGYNLRPRIGKREESRPTIERKTQQGGPVRSRKGRERNESPYIEERTRSSNKNARRGGDQQRQDQERRGMGTKKSLSLEVLVGNVNYKS
ncbi:retrovirus-related Pol polyprotein from transposon opus [Trichonephila clavipes]|nr:retrovirus-related Pol polyprotein from transposon opus [Trichonephila clavipes]